MAALSAKSRSPTTMQISLPGWSFDDLDQQGHLRLWRALFTLDYAREFAFDEGLFDYREVERTHMTYVRCLNIEAQASLLETHEENQHAFKYPFTIDLSLTHIGRTSLRLDHEVKDMKGNLMMNSALTYVFVDNISNHVSHAPKWWATKYKPLMSENEKPFKVEIPEKFFGSFKYELVVSPTDIDYYGHVNNTAYHKFCTNAGMTAANKGLLGNILPHVIDTKAKKIESEYITDSVAGEKLIVHVNTDNVEQITYFLIVKDDNEPVFRQKLYY